MEVAREFLESSLEPSLRDPAFQPSEAPEVNPTAQTSHLTVANRHVLHQQCCQCAANLRDKMECLQCKKFHRLSYSPNGNTVVHCCFTARAAFVQRSTLTTTSTVDGSGMWYILAMMLPLFSVNNNNRWRCTPSAILNTAELFLSHLGNICNHIRCHIRRLAENNISRELFATAMDIVLVVYAIGFLILSMYQAAIIG